MRICQGAISFVMVALLILTMAQAAHAGDWPMKGHDLSHSGVADEMVEPPLELLWKYTTGSAVQSSPAVSGGVVYVRSVYPDNNVYALDAATGALKWKYTTTSGGSASPAVSGGVVYVGSVYQENNVYALDAATGALKWKYATGDAVYSSPAVSSGVVYVGSYDNNVYALDATTGALKWKYATGGAIESSPAVSGGVVYVGSGDNFGGTGVYAIDAATGVLKWKYATEKGKYVDSSPAVSGGAVYVGSFDNNVYALDSASGALKWKYTTGKAVESSPAVSGGVVYVGSDDNNVYALDSATGALKWKYTTGDAVRSSPSVSDGVVYVGSDDNNIYALDSATGALKWKYTTGKAVYSSPVVSGSVVYVGSDDGNVYAFAPTRVPTSITVSPATASAATGDTKTFSASTFDQKNNPMTVLMTWTSSNPSVGVIDNNGIFSAIAAGTTVITAANGTISGTATVKVNEPPDIPNSPSPDIGASNQPINPTLSWSGDDQDGDTVTYTVYLDTNSNPKTSKCSSITSRYCSVTDLSYSTTYYWKVTASDGKASPVSGPVWSFITQADVEGAIVVSVSSVPASIKPGQTSIIKVIANGEDNQSIPGATVRLNATPASSGKINPALGTTDNNGIFTSSFNGSAEGTVTINIRVSKENLLDGKKDIQILIQPKNSDNISSVAISFISIKGTITDSETGENLSGATVAIGSISNKTGLDGKYELKVNAGEYDNLTITREGYEAITKSAIVPEEGTIVNFSIKKIPLPPPSPFPWYWILLLLVPISGGLGYAKYKKKKKTEYEILESDLKTEGKPAQESASFPATVLIHTSNKNPTVKGVNGNKIDVKSAYEYRCAKILYKVKLENNTSEPTGDIKVNLFVPPVFLLIEKEKTIPMLEPKESATVTFEIRPTGECGDCNISGRVEYYDYSTKRHEMVDIATKMVSVICPVLKRKEIDIKQWEKVTDELIKAEENIKELSVPAENLFDITSRVIKDNGMFMLKPEITSTPKLFVGCARFYAQGKIGLHYAAYIEVVGGSNKSRLILKVWAEKEEALIGFYHRILDEIEKRVDVKIFIDDSIVQIHIGDNIGGNRIEGDRAGTLVKDSFVKDSTIDARVEKCTLCGKEIEADEKICMRCGEKL